jgi:hypothetical protein
MDKRIEKIENILKDILTPYVWLIIKDLNNFLEREKYPFVLIVVGGDALHNFFPYDENLRSHDFDLRLTPIVGSEKDESLISLQHEFAIKFIKHFETELNKYKEHINPIFYRILNNTLGGKGKVSEFQAFQGLGESCSTKPLKDPKLFDLRCDLYTLQYRIVVDDDFHQDSLIDLFAIKSTNPNYETHINPYNTNIPKTSIPYMKIEGVNYASLGFLIEDTLKLIEIHKYKSERYKMKFNQIIRNLYNPSGHLSCDAMKDFINFCSSKTYCVLNGKKLDKEKILNFAISNNIIQEDMIGFFKNYSLEYLCKYVNQLQENLNIISPMQLEEF